MEWLNETFAGFDGAVFSFMHGLAESAGGFLTPLAKIVTLLGEKGVIFFLAGILLMLFAKTRKLGVCIFGAVGCGTILTTFILKGAVGRIRPFETSETFRAFWEFVGSPVEEDFCFPSGHTTAIMAAAVALFLLCSKKWSYVGFFGVLLMAFSRVYLIAHYATDVLAGMISGTVAALIAFFITKGIFHLLNVYADSKFCKFCLYFDLRDLFRRKDKNEKQQEEDTTL